MDNLVIYATFINIHRMNPWIIYLNILGFHPLFFPMIGLSYILTKDNWFFRQKKFQLIQTKVGKIEKYQEIKNCFGFDGEFPLNFF